MRIRTHGERCVAAHVRSYLALTMRSGDAERNHADGYLKFETNAHRIRGKFEPNRRAEANDSFKPVC